MTEGFNRNFGRERREYSRDEYETGDDINDADISEVECCLDVTRRMTRIMLNNTMTKLRELDRAKFKNYKS